MHTFVDNFHQSGKYTSQIAGYQAEFRREKIFADQKSLSISSLQTDYLNIYINLGSGRNNERANIFRQNALFVEVLTILQKNVLKG